MTIGAKRTVPKAREIIQWNEKRGKAIDRPDLSCIIEPGNKLVSGRRQNMSAKVSFDTPIQSGDQSFGKVLDTGLPVAALFWSGGKLDPQMESELQNRARADAGRLLIVKVRGEDNPESVRRYRINANSTLITFRDGRELARGENPDLAAVRGHIEYLLGRGTRPLDKRSVQTEGAATQEYKPFPVTDATFVNEVMRSALPVVVDFWAPWCGPCRMVSPALERIAVDFRGKIRIAKLNVDENPTTAQAYQVQSIPTLLFVKNGQIADRLVGALPEGQIRTRVDRFLKF